MWFSILYTTYDTYDSFIPLSLPGWFHLEQPVGAERAPDTSWHPEPVGAWESQAAGSGLHPFTSGLWPGMSDYHAKRWVHLFSFMFTRLRSYLYEISDVGLATRICYWLFLEGCCVGIHSDCLIQSFDHILLSSHVYLREVMYERCLVMSWSQR